MAATRISDGNTGVSRNLSAKIPQGGASFPTTTPQQLLGGEFNRRTSNYTLQITDSFRVVEMNVASENTLTIPPNSSVAFPVGTIITVTEYNTGRTSVVAGGGVNIRSANGTLKMDGQPIILLKVDTDDWYLFGSAPKLYPSRHATFYTDFLGGAAGEFSSNNTSGAGAGASFNSSVLDTIHFGFARTTLGTTTTGRCFLNGSNLQTQGGEITFETIVYAASLSNATDTYILYAGGINGFTVEPTDGIYFRYTHDVNSGNWQGITRRNSSETAVNSSVAVAATTFYKLTFIVNAAGTNVDFYVNDVLIGSSTTNIPQGTSADQMNFSIGARKTAGTTSVQFDWDYFFLDFYLTVER